MPESVTRFLLKRRFIIRPGLESSDPFSAANRYIEVFSQHGRSIQGKRVLVFGYGGRFAVGVELLRQGAAHVVLAEDFDTMNYYQIYFAVDACFNSLPVDDGGIR